MDFFHADGVLAKLMQTENQSHENLKCNDDNFIEKSLSFKRKIL